MDLYNKKTARSAAEIFFLREDRVKDQIFWAKIPILKTGRMTKSSHGVPRSMLI